MNGSPEAAEALLLEIPDARIRALLLRLAEELPPPGFTSAALVELMVAQLAIELGRHCAGIRECRGSDGLSS